MERVIDVEGVFVYIPMCVLIGFHESCDEKGETRNQVKRDINEREQLQYRFPKI